MGRNGWLAISGRLINPLIPRHIRDSRPETLFRARVLVALLVFNGMLFLASWFVPKVGGPAQLMAGTVAQAMLFGGTLLVHVLSLYIFRRSGSFALAGNATFAIWNTSGLEYSLFNLLLAAGTKGKRHALPHAKVMLHQPYGGITGQASDIKIQAEEIVRAKKMLTEVLAKHTGMSVEKIAEETERDKYMTAQEALEYGLIDEVLEEPEENAEGEENSKDKKKK